MTPALSLEVRPVLGCSLDEAVWQGCLLASQLNVHHVNFEANDCMFTCYSSGALKMEKGKPGRWTWEKSGVWYFGMWIDWTFHPPITGDGR